MSALRHELHLAGACGDTTGSFTASVLTAHWVLFLAAKLLSTNRVEPTNNIGPPPAMPSRLPSAHRWSIQSLRHG